MSVKARALRREEMRMGGSVTRRRSGRVSVWGMRDLEFGTASWFSILRMVMPVSAWISWCAWLSRRLGRLSS